MNGYEKAWAVILSILIITAGITISIATVSYNWKESELAKSGLSYVEITNFKGWIEKKDAETVSNSILEIQKISKKKE